MGIVTDTIIQCKLQWRADMSFCAVRNGHDTDTVRLKWLMNWLMFSVAANEGSDEQLRQNSLFLRKHIN